MPSYRQVAASVRRAKDVAPENFCDNPRCLWRCVTQQGFKPCPKHQKAETTPYPGGK